MNSLERRISRLRTLRAIQDAGRGIRLPASAIVFEQPASVVDAVYRRPGTGLYLCLHGKPYVIPCRACRRTATAANENFVVLVESIKRKSLAEIQIT
jgi:hypothetical protein